MKTKHARTLAAIYTKPTLGAIVFSDIESLVAALGGEIHEGAGSRIAFELNGQRRYHHRRIRAKRQSGIRLKTCATGLAKWG